jgi:hypothetical protein
VAFLAGESVRRRFWAATTGSSSAPAYPDQPFGDRFATEILVDISEIPVARASHRPLIGRVWELGPPLVWALMVLGELLGGRAEPDALAVGAGAGARPASSGARPRRRVPQPAGR